ncbi:MAG: PorV/PorQ family protein, partial [Bacteroidales bacterium]
QTMKTFAKYIVSLILIGLLVAPAGFAGNKQRIGQAGAPELLINPWAGSSGMGDANVANISGLEAITMNIAGAAFVNRTELGYANTNWLVGTDISVNAFGLVQKVGDAGAMGVFVQSLNLGEIDVTTVDNPEGGLGTFNPKFSTIGLSYSKEFSNSIYGGAVMKIVTGGIADMKTAGVALDAGIQYVTGSQRQLHFGITLRNVGPTMKYTGDGLSFRGVVPPNGVDMTVEHRSAEFELPTQVKIGLAYDFNFGIGQRITLAGAFTSNSFSKDQYHIGLEYDFKNILMLRGGFVYEEGLNPFEDDYLTRTSVFTGPTGGVSLRVPLNKDNGSVFSIDYSFRDTDPFQGVHTIGARIIL